MIYLLLIVGAAGAVGVNRDPRWNIWGEPETVTRVIKQHQIVTEATPSSCVVVQMSLPPCRHLRAIQNVKPSPTVKIMTTDAPVQTSQGWKPILQPSDPIPPLAPEKGATPSMTSQTTSGWGWSGWNLFGAKKETVTKMVTIFHTTKYMDPNTVVTFSVKGCKPSVLPFDLPECKPPRLLAVAPPMPPPAPERGVIVMAPIQFVPAVDDILPVPYNEVKADAVKPIEEKLEEVKPLKTEENKTNSTSTTLKS